MGKTIIQPIGPLYGEPVNGTVYGRPNGSVYVPLTNTIALTTTGTHITNVLNGGAYRVRFSNSDGAAVKYSVVATSQDIASSIRMIVASDNDLSTILTTYTFAAGLFNIQDTSNVVMNYELTPGDTYYVAAVLMNNNVIVATSTIMEVEAV